MLFLTNMGRMDYIKTLTVRSPGTAVYPRRQFLWHKKTDGAGLTANFVRFFIQITNGSSQ